MRSNCEQGHTQVKRAGRGGGGGGDAGWGAGGGGDAGRGRGGGGLGWGGCGAGRAGVVDVRVCEGFTSASLLKILSSTEPSALLTMLSNRSKASSHRNGKGLSWSTSGSRPFSFFTASSSEVTSALCASARMGAVTGSTSWRTVFATSAWETRLG